MVDQNRPAFDALVTQTQDALKATIERRIGPLLRQRLNPEDVLQETYLRAQQSFDRIEWRGHAAFGSSTSAWRSSKARKA
jgi:DNA-directed RNA polymerase specialized sigma24 family protein